jgi:hypothetical protein
MLPMAIFYYFKQEVLLPDARSEEG